MKKKILEDFKDSDIFAPLHTFWSDFDDDAPQDNNEIVVQHHPPDIKPLLKKINQPVVKIKKNRFGRSDLHEAVAMSDIAEINRLLDAGASIKATDNNGQTPIDQAFVDENDDVLI